MNFSFIFFIFCSKMYIVRWGIMGLFDKFKKILDVENSLHNEGNEKINCIHGLEDSILLRCHFLGKFPGSTVVQTLPSNGL